MTDWTALKAAWAAQPGGNTAVQSLAAIRAMTVQVTPPTPDVPVSAVMNELMIRGAWSAIELLAAHGAPSGQNPLTAGDHALGSAIALVRKCTATPDDTFKMSDNPTATAVLAQFQYLVTAGTILQADADAVTALAQPVPQTVSWLSANGYADNLNDGDLVAAGILTADQSTAAFHPAIWTDIVAARTAWQANSATAPQVRLLALNGDITADQEKDALTALGTKP